MTEIAPTGGGEPQGIIDHSLEPRLVPAAHGWQWIKQSFQLFLGHPGLWILLTLIFFLLMLVLDGISRGLLSYLASPGMAAGLMYACHQQKQGEEIEIGHLFAGWQRRWRESLALGGLNVAGFMVLGLLLVLLIWAVGLADVFLPALKDPAYMHKPELATRIIAEGQLGVMLLVGLLALLGLMIQMLALWLSPALVLLANQSAWDAYWLSLRAGMLNWRALTVMGLAGMMLCFVAVMPMMLGLIVLVPVMMISSYAAYADLFPTAS